MDNEKPKKIKIMADHAFAYCWNMANDCPMLLSELCVGDATGLAVIEKDLEAWQGWFERDADYRNEASLPWDEFHDQGVSLASRLAIALKPFGVEVYYDRPSEDPKGKESAPFKVE